MPRTLRLTDLNDGSNEMLELCESVAARSTSKRELAKVAAWGASWGDTKTDEGRRAYMLFTNVCRRADAVGITYANVESYLPKSWKE